MGVEDVYEIEEDREFEKIIQSKYNSFIAKTVMLGYAGITFEYLVENYEVILTKYTGTSNDIVLPPFVTAIGKAAFAHKNVVRLKLNNGLKIIGGRCTGT